MPSKQQASKLPQGARELANARSLYSRQLTAQALQRASTTESNRVGLPRLDAYTRVLHRFFEPLILLSVLGVTRGPHSTTSEQDAGDTVMARRRLLQNLSYLCDFDKGGPSTTSIGIEERQTCYNFWVSSNKVCSDKIIRFLSSVLKYLRDIRTEESNAFDENAQTLAVKCIQFAKKRVTKESKLFFQAISRCMKYLDPDNSTPDRQLVVWLKVFDEVDHVKLCNQAFDERQSKEATLLDPEGPVLSRGGRQSESAQAFRDVKHYLGRLAHHIRAPNQVIDDAYQVNYLFESYFVRQIPTPAGVLRPDADNHTHLRGILKRMLGQDDESKYPELISALEEMDGKLNLGKKIMEEYAKEEVQTVVHCEIQVLEHFYQNRLTYAGNDRYIGCSKPACFCCHLYIQHHPARCVVPDSHRKIYLNWGPPTLDVSARNSKNPEFRAQRKLLSRMSDTIRVEAEDQIVKKAGPKTWHPDSMTGITPLAEGFSQLEIRDLPKFEGPHVVLQATHANTASSRLTPAKDHSNERSPNIVDAVGNNNSHPLSENGVLPLKLGRYNKLDAAANDESDLSDGGATLTP